MKHPATGGDRMNRASSVFIAAVLLSAAASALSAQQQPAPPENATISMDRARAIALAQVPNNEGVTSAKLKTKNGVLMYQFDIGTPGPGHQEVRVNAWTGYVISNTHEDDLIGKAGDKVSKAAQDAGNAVARTTDKVFGKDQT